MLSEFNVRAEVSHIEALDVSPLQKARMLLKVAKRVKAAARRLAMLSQHHYRIEDPLCGARFREAAQRLVDMHAEVRTRAAGCLRGTPKHVGYGYTPSGNAYPTWNVAELTPLGGAR